MNAVRAARARSRSIAVRDEVHGEAVRALHRAAVEHVRERLGVGHVSRVRDRCDQLGEPLRRELLERAAQLGDLRDRAATSP